MCFEKRCRRVKGDDLVSAVWDFEKFAADCVLSIRKKSSPECVFLSTHLAVISGFLLFRRASALHLSLSSKMHLAVVFPSRRSWPMTGTFHDGISARSCCCSICCSFPLFVSSHFPVASLIFYCGGCRGCSRTKLPPSVAPSFSHIFDSSRMDCSLSPVLGFLLDLLR